MLSIVLDKCYGLIFNSKFGIFYFLSSSTQKKSKMEKSGGLAGHEFTGALFSVENADIK